VCFRLATASASLRQSWQVCALIELLGQACRISQIFITSLQLLCVFLQFFSPLCWFSADELPTYKS
jgi:hypothetical protein